MDNQSQADKRKETGNIGEQKTFEILQENPIPIYHQYMKNLLVKGKDGSILAEIDILLITTRGIFVIENKELNGRIEGSRDGNYWKYRQNNGNGSSTLPNPLTQNNRHVNFLSTRLKVPIISLYSLIVLPDTARYHIRGGCKPHDYVTRRSDLPDKIINIISENSRMWNDNKVDEMIEELNRIRTRDINRDLTQEITRSTIRM